jgi:2-oxoglutarate dehydrogenase E2 component (dihydrolipoamide succinyltransferase)
MSIEVKVPQLPESVADATLVTWHKKPGDAVARDENLVDLETDKVVLEVPAPTAGVLREIRADDGATVVSGDIIALLEPGAAAAEQAAAPAAVTQAATPEAAVGSDTKTSPAVRRLIEEHGLDLARINGSGKDGRVTKADVLSHMASEPASAPADAPVAAPAVSAPASGTRREERVPMTRLRTRIAERMVEAQSNAAMLTSFNEVDLSTVMALRKQHQESFQKEHGVKLGFMSFFVKAACEVLKRYPVVNASVDGNDIVYHDYFDVGVAVSTPKGLVVPVLRDADQMSFADVERTLSDLAGRARDGKIGMDELTGGTFTVTNGGVFGSLISTPILNPPQSAILGMHTIKERAVVIDGQVVARPMMYIALTYDHRIVDGRDAVLTLVGIKDLLEDPARLLLSI